MKAGIQKKINQTHKSKKGPLPMHVCTKYARATPPVEQPTTLSVPFILLKLLLATPTKTGFIRNHLHLPSYADCSGQGYSPHQAESVPQPWTLR